MASQEGILVALPAAATEDGGLNLADKQLAQCREALIAAIKPGPIEEGRPIRTEDLLP
jgi:hypothetical protein